MLGCAQSVTTTFPLAVQTRQPFSSWHSSLAGSHFVLTTTPEASVHVVHTLSALPGVRSHDVDGTGSFLKQESNKISPAAVAHSSQLAPTAFSRDSQRASSGLPQMSTGDAPSPVHEAQTWPVPSSWMVAGSQPGVATAHAMPSQTAPSPGPASVRVGSLQVLLHWQHALAMTAVAVSARVVTRERMVQMF